MPDSIPIFGVLRKYFILDMLSEGSHVKVTYLQVSERWIARFDSITNLVFDLMLLLGTSFIWAMASFKLLCEYMEALIIGVFVIL